VSILPAPTSRTRDRPLRLFVAIYPPAEHARAMLGLLSELRLAHHRVTPIEQLHITVHFIGDVQRRELDDTVESVERSASGLAAFVLTPRRLISLPERGTPRLVALKTDAPPPLPELHRRLVQRLARPRARRARADDDGFLPHFTLCRYAHDAHPPPHRFEQDAVLPPIPITEVRLMSSTLRPEGARHEVVGRWVLEG
jgi:2'-5' RNA ligase